MLVNILGKLRRNRKLSISARGARPNHFSTPMRRDGKLQDESFLKKTKVLLPCGR